LGRFDLSDEEQVIIEPYFPKAGRGPVRQDDRRILKVSSIFCELVHRGTIYRSVMCRERQSIIVTTQVRPAQIWKSIFVALAKERKDSLIFIESSIIRAHRAAHMDLSPTETWKTSRAEVQTTLSARHIVHLKA
jgi:transposase